MNKFCEGVGVFNTNDAERFQLYRRSYGIGMIYGLENGNFWVYEEPQRDRTFVLSKVSYLRAAQLFTTHNVDIPKNLVDRFNDDQ